MLLRDVPAFKGLKGIICLHSSWPCLCWLGTHQEPHPLCSVTHTHERTQEDAPYEEDVSLVPKPHTLQLFSHTCKRLTHHIVYTE